MEERAVQMVMSGQLSNHRTRRVRALADVVPVVVARRKAPLWVRLAVCRTADALMAEGTFSVKARINRDARQAE